jgi:hypothetical protein
MRTTAARYALLAVLAAIAVVLFIVLSSGDDEDPGTDTQAAEAVTQGAGNGVTVETGVAANIVVENGEPVGGVVPIEASRGERISLTIEVDPPEDEVHVHGYEITEPARSSPVQLSFEAELDGVFEIELHRTDGSEVEIAKLRVNP